MDAKIKKISKVNFDHAKKQIQHQTERCVEIIKTALEVAKQYTGHRRIWFGDFSNPPLVKEGYSIEDIYVNCNTLWVSMSGEYDNGMMPIENIDIWYLIDLTEWLRDHIHDFIEIWEEDNLQ